MFGIRKCFSGSSSQPPAKIARTSSSQPPTTTAICSSLQPAAKIDSCSSSQPPAKIARRRVAVETTNPYPEYLQNLIEEKESLEITVKAVNKEELKAKDMELRIISAAVELERIYYNQTQKLRQDNKNQKKAIKNKLPEYISLAVDESFRQRLIYRVCQLDKALVKTTALKNALPRLFKINEEKNKTFSNSRRQKSI
uniref:Uncharacterized protein LOC114324453 n=1 Tax=Diabrotica virgifera virgifera TaxID=50390 RepID=A0A6P7EYN8_DIAVI